MYLFSQNGKHLRFALEPNILRANFFVTSSAVEDIQKGGIRDTGMNRCHICSLVEAPYDI